MRSAKLERQMILQRISDLEKYVRAYYAELDMLESLEKNPVRKPTVSLENPAIMRFIDKTGSKALTVAYAPAVGPDIIFVGVSDSGSAQQFIKKAGVQIAKKRLITNPIAIQLNVDSETITKRDFVDAFTSAFGLKEATYETLSAALRDGLRRVKV